MSNLDMKKDLKHLYAPSSKHVSIVDIAPMNYLMIDGEGNPNTAEQYQEAVVAIYKLAYGIRAICKDNGNKFTVMPLEGLWEIKGQEAPPNDFNITLADKDLFKWTLMILQPDFVTKAIMEQARDIVMKKKDSPPSIADVRFEAYHEGEAVQILHIGSYDDETENVAKLHHYIDNNGWTLGKRHHEIYLNDPRKVDPSKLKTVIRQPFKR